MPHTADRIDEVHPANAFECAIHVATLPAGTY